MGGDPSKERNSQPGETESAPEESQNCLLKGKRCMYVPFGMWALVNSALRYPQGSLPSRGSRGKKLGKPSGYLYSLLPVAGLSGESTRGPRSYPGDD